MVDLSLIGWFHPRHPLPKRGSAATEFSRLNSPTKVSTMKIKRGHEVIVAVLPDCDFCPDGLAEYDGRTVRGYWANMCGVCFTAYGVGTGVGKGQRLIV